MCSEAYHAPTSCATLKHWLVKCRDDSGTANYMTAHTKDCPSCHVCIEKNEGCNHMVGEFILLFYYFMTQLKFCLWDPE